MWRIQVVALCWLATASLVSSSTTTLDTATLRSMGLSRKEIKEVVKGERIEEEEVAEVEEEIDEEEEPWKANEDWWKDPLAMFSDDEEEIEEIMEEEAVAVQEEAVAAQEEAVATKEEIVEEAVAPVVEEEARVREAKVTELEEEATAPAEEIEEPSEIVTEAVTIETKEAPKSVEKKSDSSGKKEARKGGSAGRSVAVLVPLLPKVQSALSSVPVIQLAASALVAKTFIDAYLKKMSGKKETQLAEYLDDDDASKETLESRERVAKMPSDESLDELEDASTPEVEARTSTSGRSRPGWLGVGSMLGRTSDGRRIPPARDLLVQVDSLKAELSRAESERDAMEKEYEKASFQLQEAQTELGTLSTTTRYLKAQLRDNEEVQNKAIRAERRKAKEELARMKEAMVSILDKERRAMRDELKRQTSELRTLLMEATGEGGEVASEES